MIELMVLPAWQAPPRVLDDWISQLGASSHRVEVSRESKNAVWLELPALRLRGYAVLEGQRVEAINFELNANDPAPALALIEAAAQALNWEVHEDEVDPEDDLDDED